MTHTDYAYEYLDKIERSLKTYQTKKKGVDGQLAVLQVASENWAEKIEIKQADLEEIRELIRGVEEYGTALEREELRAGIMDKYDQGKRPSEAEDASEEAKAFQAEIDKIRAWDMAIKDLDAKVRVIYYRKK